MSLSQKQKELIEKIGIHFEDHGLQPAAARVLALLFVSQTSELTFDEIREELNMSKSAISNAINRLLTTKQIEYFTKPGDRKRYFRNKIDNWIETMKSSQQKMIVFKNLLSEVLDLHTETNHPKAVKYKEMIEFLEFIKVEFPLLIERWQAQRKQ